MKNIGHSGIIVRGAAVLAGALLIAAHAGANESEGLQESSLLAQGRAALEDNLYGVARENLETLLETTSEPRERSQYALMLAEALHGLQKFEQMRDLLLQHREQASQTPWADDFEASLAFAWFGLEEWDEADSVARDFENQYPESPHLPYMIRLRALSSDRLGKIEQAVSLLGRFSEAYEESPEWDANQLDLGLALVRAGRDAEAADVLERLLELNPEGRIGHECRLNLGTLYTRAGNYEKAHAVMKPLLTLERVPDEMRVNVISALVDNAKARDNLAEAVDVLDAGLEQLADSAIKADCIRQKGMLLLKLDRTEEGVALVRSIVASKPAKNAAGDIQLELAGTLLGRGHSTKALAEYQNYLETFSDPEGIARANEGKGWALFELGRYEEAAASFEQAAELSSEPPDRALCLFKIGDCHFAAGRFERAVEAYEKVMEHYPETPLADRALFQTADARARSGQPEHAEALLWALFDKDHMGPLAGTALLNIARLKERRHELDGALAAYALAYSDGGPGARAPALYGIGNVYYRKGLFREALGYFEEVTRSFPDSSAADVSYYMLGWCFYMLGEDEAAAGHFDEFVNKFPGSPWAPHAVFWAGEHEYNRGAYAEAEQGFMRFVQEYPESAMADLALFWAGRAALMQKEFRRANEYFTRLIKDYPASDKRGEARFFQGEALCEMGEFAAAILVFDEIVRSFPKTYLAEMALFRRGDSQFTLGSDDPERYAEAVASYQAVLDSPEVSDQSRLQAKYKIGRCIEKLGRGEEAIEYYMKVVYTYLESGSRSPQANVWFTRAAFNAAELKERENNWAAALNIYQRVVDADVPASRDAQERINRIRRDHWLFFY